MPAPARQVQHRREHHGQREQHPYGIGDAEYLSAADREDGVGVGAEVIDHLVLRQHDGERAADRQRTERHHERRQAQPGDQHAVHRAGGEAGGKPGGHRQPPRLGILQHQPGDDGSEPHHRAHRQIDAASHDDRRHAQCHDADEGEVARDVVEILDTGEGMRLQRRHDHAHRQQHHRHPERLRRQHALRQRVFALLDNGGHRDGGLKRHRSPL